jgi:hypothetical protein
MQRPAGGPARPDVDENRSVSSAGAGEPQVSRAEMTEDPDPSDNRADRA